MNNEKAIELLERLKDMATENLEIIQSFIDPLKEYQKYIDEEIKKLDEDFKS